MKKLIALLLIVLIVFAVVNRQRVFVRDPLGAVSRGGVAETGAQVYLNYSSDVLLQNDGPPLAITLVQRDRPVGLPKNLRCIHYVVCLADAYPATLAGTEPGARIDAMAGNEVVFHDAARSEVVVKLH